MQRTYRKSVPKAKVSLDALASIAQRQSTAKVQQTRSQHRVSVGDEVKKQRKKSSVNDLAKYSTKQLRNLLAQLKWVHENMPDPATLDDRIKDKFQKTMTDIDSQIAMVVGGSRSRSISGVLKGVHQQPDGVVEVLDGIVSTANGYISGSYSSDTMRVVQDMASGKQDASATLAQSILGNTANELQRVAMRDVASYTPTIPSPPPPPTVDAQAVCAVAQTQAEGALEMTTSAAEAGMARLKQLNSMVGDGTGARDLLQSCMQNVTNQVAAMMMGMVMGVVNAVHPISHSLFMQIMEMTWDQNRQWVPEFIGPQDFPPWMVRPTEICEYFDFVQEVMGGAIADIWKGADELYEQIVQQSTGFNIDETKKKIEEYKAAASAAAESGLPPPQWPPGMPDVPTSVPLMSIAKQQWDVQQKLCLLKEQCRERGKLILARMCSLEGPDLRIIKPEQLLLVMEVCVEVYVIYQNLGMVIDKIVEFFLNMLIEKFAGIAKSIIDQLLQIWKEVTEIVPPLQDFMDMAWTIPNTADCCHCAAMNIALPECKSIIKPFLDMPFTALDNICSACDTVCEQAYAIPPP